jgi:hypothetical protein
MFAFLPRSQRVTRNAFAEHIDSVVRQDVRSETEATIRKAVTFDFIDDGGSGRGGEFFGDVVGYRRSIE